jgi:hypothetical protein
MKREDLQKAEVELFGEVLPKRVNMNAEDDGVNYEEDEELRKAEDLIFGDEFEKAEFSEKERKNLAKKKEAMPDGSYPIRNASDLSNAIQAFGRAKNPAATKRWIKKRAKELGKEDMLPETWKANVNEFSDGEIDIEKAQQILGLE